VILQNLQNNLILLKDACRYKMAGVFWYVKIYKNEHIALFNHTKIVELNKFEGLNLENNDEMFYYIQ